MLLRPLLTHAVGAAYAAGQAILRLYQTTAAVEYKADLSPLTAADRASHELILAALRTETGLPVLSEESREIPFAERSTWDCFWLVDPLDGTKEFIKRNGEFTVNIALVQAGRPVLGVVFAPVLATLYVGAHGMGAFRAAGGRHFHSRAELAAGASDPAAAGWEHLPSSGRATDGSVRVVASRSHENAETRDYIQRLRAGHEALSLVSIGSSLKLCLLAEGSADVYPRLAPTMEWDTAAAHAVVEASGGEVLEYPGTSPLRYNKPNLLNPFFVARRHGWRSAVPQD